MMNRTLAKIWAHLWGYFWLPCPICGEMFGGHEGSLGVLIVAPGDARLTCSKLSCRVEAARRNAQPELLSKLRQAVFLLRSRRIISEEEALALQKRIEENLTNEGPFQPEAVK